MKKQALFFFIALLLNYSYSITKPIDEETAQKIANSFFSSDNPLLETNQIKLVYKCSNISFQNHNQVSKPIDIYYYIFNFGANSYLILAGDDASHPILGYSNESSFEISNIPSNLEYWLKCYEEQIKYILSNNLQATDEIKNEWKQIGNKKWNFNQIQAAVNPLIKTKWNQSPFYNDMCPYDYDAKERAVSGCVATAMAQIMKYWNYPATGSGIHTYNHSVYGILSANFGVTNYDWNNMPNSVNSRNDAVAKLMYHCGVSVDMDYGVEGSGARGSIDVAPSLLNYFNYNSGIEIKKRSDFSYQEWHNIIINELVNQRPIYYQGSGGKSGHAFVCDGYDNNEFFHFNWGWGGMYDGFFRVNQLNPGNDGIGSGEGTYNDNQEIIVGIQPPSNQMKFELQLYDDVSVNETKIFYTKNFSVFTNIENIGTTTFDGDYCAGVFDMDDNFIDFVEILSKVNPLPPNYHFTENLEFSTEGLISMVPGKYKIYIFYRPKDGEWKQIRKDSWDWFTDEYTVIEVINENPIMLYSEISTYPAYTIVQDESLSVFFNVENQNTYTFKGSYAAALMDINGKIVKTINIIDENDGLPSNYHYSERLEFNADKLDVEAGTYYVLGFYKYHNNDTWYWIGSQETYTNPIKIVISEKPLNPDIYEVNNSVNSAKKMNLQFTSNTSTFITTGSNIHENSDVDYYKIELPSGYNYEISGWIEDIFSAGQIGGFTLDGIFQYSPDGKNWSETYDESLEPNIDISGPVTIYFKVLPFFSGQKGTYQLNFEIIRSQSSKIAIELSGDLNFQSVEVGKTLNRNLIIKNSGNSEMIVSSIDFPLGYSVNWKSGTIPAGQSKTVIVTFSPTQKKSYTGVIKINSNATSGNNSISVNGIGVDPNSIAIVQNFDSISLYPNPAINLLNVSCELEIETIRIVDEIGIIRLQLCINGRKSSTFDIKILNSGLYLCEIITSNGFIKTIPFMVSK